MVTVELQLCSDILFSPVSSDGRQNKIGVLLGAGLVGNNTIVI